MPPRLLPLLLIAAGLAGAAPDSAPPRPRLQVFNGSSQPAEIFWLKSGAERVPNGSLAPGANTVITTTIGHRFVIVGREDAAEEEVTATLPVQAFVYRPLAPGAARHPVPPDTVVPPPPQFKIPGFHRKFISASGYPIVASERVSDYALREAAHLVNLMLARRPDVREAMIASGSRLCIIAHNEFTTDLPEFSFLAAGPVPGYAGIAPGDYWDARARGTGGSATDPYCSAGEENLLGYRGDPYAAECILIHEFAHNIHLRGMVNIDPTFDRRLRSAYDAAMRAGLWKGKYASVNHHEYFAEGVQSWFDDNRENDHDHNHVNTRSELQAYDPGLAAICGEVFGATVVKYSKPATRLRDHLAGYDPARAPRFEWPERLGKVKDEIKRRAAERDRAANGGGEREARDLAGWQVRVSRRLLGEHGAATARALGLLEAQLREIVRVVPGAAVADLRKVPLWVSPEYPGFGAKAEYHPDAGWLTAHGRDPAMARGVEFTNVGIFEAECRRMPLFVLHELAHAYHHRVLGHDHPGIRAAFESATAGGKYERVERQDAAGRRRLDRAYALTNPQEYFAECTEAFFGRNDFFPYTRDELRGHDPEMFRLLERVWRTGADSAP